MNTLNSTKYWLLGMVAVCCFFQGCEDPEAVESPEFSVDFTPTAKVGEAVTFGVADAPDFLNFYSGEFGNQYKYRDRTEAEGKVYMSFKNAQKWGVGTNATGTLSVLVSTDYDGSGDSSSVKNATWTDISDRFEIATAYDYAWTESGVAEITDLATGSPIYFGFKFYAEDNASNGNRQPEWRIADFSIELVTDDAPAALTVATDGNPGFLPADVQGKDESFNTAKWYYNSAGPFWVFRGQPFEGTNEDWLITNAVSLTAVDSDRGQPLKNYSNALKQFTHTFSKAGTYSMTFVGNNTTIYGSKEVIKEYSITVTE